MKKLKQTRVAVDGTTQFSDLPSCLVMDILSRLPITTLLTCRTVCKDWNRLLQEPYFIKLQRTASPVHVLCINSGNGLLCLADCDHTKPRSICLFNPILGEWVSISTPVRNNCLLSLTLLVFSAKKNHNHQYKLLHGFKTVEKSYGFDIYTLGDGTRQWRTIPETLACIPMNLDDFNALLHGSLHWIAPKTRDFICCFDVDSEKFRRLSLPSSSGGKSSDSSRLGVINGCLCALFSWERRGYYNQDGRPMEIWSMKESGVEESWTLMLTLSGFSSPLLYSLNEEEFLICDWYKGLISYNVKTERCRRQPPCRKKQSYFHFGVAYKPSFISLQDVAKGEQVQIIQ